MSVSVIVLGAPYPENEPLPRSVPTEDGESSWQATQPTMLQQQQ